VVGLVDVHLLAHRLGGVPELVTDPRRSTACAQRRQPPLHGVGGGQVNSSLRCGVEQPPLTMGNVDRLRQLEDAVHPSSFAGTRPQHAGASPSSMAVS